MSRPSTGSSPPGTRTTRAHAAAAIFALCCALGSTRAQAQDAEAPPPGDTAQAPAAQPTEAERAPPAPAPSAAPRVRETPRYARPRPAPPIMVVVVAADRISQEVSAAAREALVAQITPLAGGRAVHGLGVAEMVQAIGACTEDACIGAQLATAGAQAGVLLRLTRRGRQLAATLEIRDPVSGTIRAEPVEGRLPMGVAELVEPLAQMSAQLASAMPSPPPGIATLLVTTTHDGGRVSVDGEDIGESPVGPIEIADGPHQILVRLAGFGAYHTETQVRPGQRARVDATLTSLTATDDGETAGQPNPFAPTGGRDGGDELTGQWWFWAAVGGGAAVLLGVLIGVGVAASSGGQPAPMTPGGIPLPPITGGP